MKKLLKNVSGIALTLGLCAALIACNGAQDGSADTTNASTAAGDVTEAVTEASTEVGTTTEADATAESATEDITVEESTAAESVEESTPAVSDEAATTAPDTTPVGDLMPSEFDGVQEIYVSGTTVATGITVGDYAITTCILNGDNILDGIIAEKGGKLTLNEATVSALEYGENILTVADANGAEYTIILYSGVAEGEIAYFDFDINSYSNTDSAAVPSTVEENGIDGKSLHLTKSSKNGNLFGFFKNGDYGFPSFTFVSGVEYKLCFDLKILDGTADAWWCPIRFGDNGDVIYIYPDGTWKTAGNNVLYSQATMQDMGSGLYRVTAIFKATDATVNLDFPSWGGAVDVLIDNVCIEKLDENLIRIGCVGDSITESSNNRISYPEWLQMMLGYDNYYVFNFGKSASNVLEEGALPYRTHAEWQYNALKGWNPDVIFTMLGTNDGRPTTGISVYKDKAFIEDYTAYVKEFKELADEVYMLISPYAFGDEFGIDASLVNDHIVNVEGYIAYLEKLPVIDVHAAVKGLDREIYFTDYIHGSDAGNEKIAEAVLEGYINGHNAGKYALKYALTTASNKTSQAYLDAKAVYDSKNATQEEIDAAFNSIKDTITIPDAKKITYPEKAVDVAASGVTHINVVESGLWYDMNDKAGPSKVTTFGIDMLSNFKSQDVVTYKINVIESGTYDFAINYAYNWDNGATAKVVYKVIVDDGKDTEKTYSSSLLNKRANAAHTVYSAPVRIELTAGEHTLKVVSGTSYQRFEGIRLAPAKENLFPDYTNEYSTVNIGISNGTTDSAYTIGSGESYGYLTNINEKFDAISICGDNSHNSVNGETVSLWEFYLYEWKGSFESTVSEANTPIVKDVTNKINALAFLTYEFPTQDAGEYFIYIKPYGEGATTKIQTHTIDQANGSVGFNYINGVKAENTEFIPYLLVTTTEPYEGDLFGGALE